MAAVLVAAAVTCSPIGVDVDTHKFTDGGSPANTKSVTNICPIKGAGK